MKFLTLDISHWNFTAWYDISTPYLGVTQDETMAVEISQHQFSICQAANRQFCNIYTPLQLLSNPPSCIIALYTKNATNISNRCLLQIRKTQNISLPSQITPNMWILTSTPSTSDNCHIPHLPRRNHKIYYSEETHPHLVSTTSMQCYITTLSSTPTLWTSSINC